MTWKRKLWGDARPSRVLKHEWVRDRWTNSLCIILVESQNRESALLSEQACIKYFASTGKVALRRRTPKIWCQRWKLGHVDWRKLKSGESRWGQKWINPSPQWVAFIPESFRGQTEATYRRHYSVQHPYQKWGFGYFLRARSLSKTGTAF